MAAASLLAVHRNESCRRGVVARRVFFGASSTSSMSFASKLNGGAAAITLRVLVKNFCNEGHVV